MMQIRFYNLSLYLLAVTVLILGGMCFFQWHRAETLQGGLARTEEQLTQTQQALKVSDQRLRAMTEQAAKAEARANRYNPLMQRTIYVRTHHHSRKPTR